MAMALYPTFLEAQLGASPINFSGDTIKCVLVTSAYTYNAAHDFMDDITGELARSNALASKTLTNGTFDFADPVMNAATAAGTGVAVIFFKDTGGAASTNRLIAYDDKQADGTTALSRPVLVGDVVTLQIHASGLFDL